MKKSIFYGGLILSLLLVICNPLGVAEDDLLAEDPYEEVIAAVNEYLNTSTLLQDKGDSEGAISALESALAHIKDETAPEFQELRMQIYDNIGYIYAILGENEKAFDAFAAATQTGTESPIPWLYLGALLEEAGMPEDALLMYQEAIVRDPDGVTRAQEAHDFLSGDTSTVNNAPQPWSIMYLGQLDGPSTGKKQQEHLNAFIEHNAGVKDACEIMYFYSSTCASCQRLAPWMAAFRERYPEVLFTSYNLQNGDSQARIETAKREYGISSGHIPVIFICGSILEGNDPIENFFEPMARSVYNLPIRSN